jgi:predicted aminopeptidase
VKIALPLLLTAIVALTSCRAVHFYAQGAAGQWEIIHKARPVEQMRQDPDTPPAVKERLSLVQQLRGFAARELVLPADRQYDRYTDLGRPYVVWVVYAAPEFSVEAKTWWYPVLGHLKYRGYFSEADAQREGDRLRARGLDVVVAGTGAYSTLGWLRDPVLNTFLHRSDAELAEVIFHELTHQRLYLKGDTDFNEALATAVGEAGARQWLRSQGRHAELAAYERKLRLQRDAVAAVLRTRAELAEIYTHDADEGPAHLRARKAEAFSRLRARIRHLRAASGALASRLPAMEWNNATLNTVAAYYELLPGFERLLSQCGNSIPRFLQQVEAMKSWSKDERRDHIQAR